MSNLTVRFDSFEDQVATQHAALMSRLADTNAKLDALLAAFGVPPPTATVSLADVVAAITAQTAVLSDVHLDTISMDQKLLAIRDEQADIHLDTISMDQKLLVVRNAVTDIHLDTISMDQKLLAIRDEQATIRPLLNYIYELALLIEPNVDDIRRALGLPTGDATTTVLGRLALVNFATSAIAASTGLLSSPATGTQLDLLKDIKALSKCNCGDTGPSLDDDDTCASPFVSTGMLLSVVNSNVLVATWTAPLPAGITYKNPGYDGELSNTDWTGWKVYVSSSEKQFAMSKFDLTRRPTNTWISLLAGAADYEWSVDARGGITVYLCGPAAPATVCNQYQITNAGATTDFNIPAGETTVEIIAVTGGGAIGAYGGPGVTPGNVDMNGVGYTATFIGPGFIALLNGAGGAPITVEICSPAPGPSPR